jgi:formylglycine-generating enzyme required for sulfatase activity
MILAGVAVMETTLCMFAGGTLWSGSALAQATADNAAGNLQSAAFRATAWNLPDEPLLGFTEIPAGSFPMGSNPLIDPMAFENERWSDSRRQGVVELPAYYIARFETTVGQFQAFIDATSYSAAQLDDSGQQNLPASGVSWTDALAYARWLESEMKSSDQTPAELRRLLDIGWHLTLPNEAEWEKAARGTESRIYPWGNQARKDRANFAGSGPVPVGSIPCPECPYGIKDMSGNVWEWTRSPYQPYPFTSDDDFENLAEDALWVMRGGSFNDAENNIRTAVRGAADPGARRPFIGFRLVISSN